MIVLDASAVVELVLNSARGSRVRERISDVEETLAAPHLLTIEVLQVLRRFTARSAISASRAEAALADLMALDVEYWDHEAFLPRVWALRGNLTAYDAIYVALAEGLDAPLVTTDGRLGGSPGHRAQVDVIR